MMVLKRSNQNLYVHNALQVLKNCKMENDENESVFDVRSFDAW